LNREALKLKEDKIKLTDESRFGNFLKFTYWNLVQCNCSKNSGPALFCFIIYILAEIVKIATVHNSDDFLSSTDPKIP
jgi:hypothetical protein